MIDLAKDGFTHKEVKDMLHMAQGSRNVRFRYNLLSKEDEFISELKNIESGVIEHSAFSDIKRTARFSLTEDSYTQESYATWEDIGSLSWSELFELGGM